MNAKMRLIDIGQGTYLELDGKTMGRGIECIEYKKEAGKPGELSIRISNLKDFKFERDGYFDEVEKKLLQCEPSMKERERLGEVTF